MARYQQQQEKQTYPIGSVSNGTMRPEDLIPAFVAELEHLAKRHGAKREMRKRHLALVHGIEARQTHYDYDYYTSDDAYSDLDALFDALEEYAGPYFYFGAHPGDGADYGFWLPEDWDQEFVGLEDVDKSDEQLYDSLKVNDLSDVPSWYRGEVAVVSDHGNVSLYVKTSRTMRLVWEVV